jgi:Lar family restriction alleviation protein
MSTTQAQERALAPCPFCGGKAGQCTEHDADMVLWGYVACSSCGVRTRGSFGDLCPITWAEIRAEWNRRATPPSAAPAAAWQDHPSRLYVHWLVDGAGHLVAEVGNVELGGNGAWYAVVGKTRLALDFATKQQAMQAAELTYREQVKGRAGPAGSPAGETTGPVPARPSTAAENEDAALLDWLEQRHWDADELFELVNNWVTQDGKRHPGGLRAAIRAARKDKA